jgi:hypothetical protein
MKISRASADTWDVHNGSGYWVAWVKMVGTQLKLMSTSAPLTDDERSNLAQKISREIGSSVSGV